MPWVTANSPAEPDSTKIASAISIANHPRHFHDCTGARLGLAHQKNSEANQRHPYPAPRRNRSPRNTTPTSVTAA